MFSFKAFWQGETGGERSALMHISVEAGTQTERSVSGGFSRNKCTWICKCSLTALVFTPDSNVYKHITDRPLHIFAYICIYACAHRHTRVCLTDLRKNKALYPDSPSIVPSVDDRFPFAVLGLLAVQTWYYTDESGKATNLIVLFTPQPLLGFLIYKSLKPINYIFLHPLESKWTRQQWV